MRVGNLLQMRQHTLTQTGEAHLFFMHMRLHDRGRLAQANNLVGGQGTGPHAHFVSAAMNEGV